MPAANWPVAAATPTLSAWPSNASWPNSTVPITDWVNGGFWDFTTAAGSMITTPFASVVGTNVLTPANSPALSDYALGGTKGVSIVDTTVNDTASYFTCNALASLFSGTQSSDWTVMADVRVYGNTHLGNDQPILSVCKSDGDSTHRFQLRDIAEAFGCRKYAPATPGGFVELKGQRLTNAGTGVSDPWGLGFGSAHDDHRVIWSFNSSTRVLAQYVDGVLDTLSLTTINSDPITVDRLAILAAVSSIQYEGFTGSLRLLAIKPTQTTAAQVAYLQQDYLTRNYTLPYSDTRVPQWASCGASRLQGSRDEVNGAGRRYTIARYITQNKRSWESVGPTAQGDVENRLTSAASSQGVAGITAQVSAIVSSRTKLLVLDMGDEEIDIDEDAATVTAAIAAGLHNIRGIVYAVAPQCRIMVNDLPPFSEAPRNAVCQTVNASLPGVWDTSDAQFPNNPKLLRTFLNAAIGGPSYVQANFNAAGDDHENHQGFTLEAPAILAAADSVGVTLPNVLDSLSPT